MEQEKENILLCGICKGSAIKKHIEGKDHNATEEIFSVVECEDCGYRFTSPRPKEKFIGKYYKSKNYISHNSTKKGLINKIYHIVRKYQFYKKNQLIEKHSKTDGKKILDIGCGTGDFLNYMQFKKWEIDGIEKDEGARKIASGKNNISINCDIADLKEKNKYDVITMWHVLEHIYDTQTYIEKICEIVKKEGIIVIAVPNSNSYDATKYKENWVAYDLPIHVSHFRKNDIQNIANKNNLKLKHIEPMFFDAYYISMLSSRKKGENVIKGIWNGFKSNMKAKKEKEYSSLMYFLYK